MLSYPGLVTGFFKNSKREYVLMPKSLIASYLNGHTGQNESHNQTICEGIIQGHGSGVKMICSHFCNLSQLVFPIFSSSSYLDEVEHL